MLTFGCLLIEVYSITITQYGLKLAHILLRPCSGLTHKDPFYPYNVILWNIPERTIVSRKNTPTSTIATICEAEKTSGSKFI